MGATERRGWYRRGGGAWALLLLLWVAGCASGVTKGEGKERPLILVSIPPYISLVRAIAGESVRVESALPPGFNFHLEELLPLHMERCSQPLLWIGVGAPYEKKLLRFFEAKGHPLRTIELQHSLPLLSEEEGGADLHFWLSPRLLIEQAELIEEVLGEMRPELKAQYAEGLRLLKARMEACDRSLGERLAPWRGRAILVSHAALSYFCRDYGLVQIAVEEEGKSALLRTLHARLDEAKQRGLLCALEIAGHQNRAVVAAAALLDCPLYPLDPLGEDPLRTVEEIVRAIDRS